MRPKRVPPLVAVLSVALGCLHAAGEFHAAKVAAWFSPGGGCTDAIVQELRGARREVLVQAYSFTSTPIAAALRDAHRRGVKVTAVLDESNRTAQYSSATFLANAGIPTYIDDRHAIAHNKILVVDGATIITGSFNFTRAAEANNAENLVVIKDAPALVRAYRENFRAHLAHSEPYRRAKAAPLESGGPEAGRRGGVAPPMPPAAAQRPAPQPDAGGVVYITPAHAPEAANPHHAYDPARFRGRF